MVPKNTLRGCLSVCIVLRPLPRPIVSTEAVYFARRSQNVSATIASALCNYLTDFCGQKLWAFKSQDRELVQTVKEFGYYILVRGGNLALAMGVWYLLLLLGMVWWVAAGIVFAIFWTIVFFFYRWVFSGSQTALYPAMRKLSRSFEPPVTQSTAVIFLC